MHVEFNVNEGAEEAEGGAFAVVGVEDCKFFFLWVEGDVIVCAPVVDELLAVVKFVEYEWVGCGGVELLED